MSNRKKSFFQSQAEFWMKFAETLPTPDLGVKSAEGVLFVSEDGEPMVKTDIGVHKLSGVTLSKHADGTWNFNMTLDAKYSAYKEGCRVTGCIVINDNTFTAWSLNE